MLSRQKNLSKTCKNVAKGIDKSHSKWYNIKRSETGTQNLILRNCVKVARQSLNLFVAVRIRVPQPIKQSHRSVRLFYSFRPTVSRNAMNGRFSGHSMTLGVLYPRYRRSRSSQGRRSRIRVPQPKAFPNRVREGGFPLSLRAFRSGISRPSPLPAQTARKTGQSAAGTRTPGRAAGRKSR